MREANEAKRVAGAEGEVASGTEKATADVEGSGEEVEAEEIELVTRDEEEAKIEAEGRRELARR
jgi:hypothetical protein